MRRDALRVGEDVLQLGDQLDHREVLVLDLLALERGQPSKLHLEDRVRLDLREREALHQVVARVLDVRRLADGADDRVEVVEGDLQSFEDVSPIARLLEVELGASANDFAAPLDVVLKDRLERQRLRLSVDQCDHVGVEGQLQLRVLEQVVQHGARVGVSLALDDEAHPVAVGLVAQVGDALDLLAGHELRDLLDQVGLVDLVRQLGDDDRHAVLARLLEGALRLHDHAAAAVRIQVADRVDPLLLAGQRVAPFVVAEDGCAGREVRAEDVVLQSSSVVSSGSSISACVARTISPR